MNLLVLSYNNYYNRIVKKETNIDGYLNYKHVWVQNVNFNPNDGCDTEQIINWGEDWTPDYLVCSEQEALGTTKIISRWFITEAVRTRNKQYKLTLHRDVIVDNYEQVVNAPCFIEKATLDDSNDLIFNSEGMNFNQIKTSEALLKDNSDTAWIVGYVAKKGITDEEDPDTHIAKNIVNGTIEGLPSGSYTDITRKSWASKIVVNDTTKTYILDNNDSINLVINTRIGQNTNKEFLFGVNNTTPKYYYDEVWKFNWNDEVGSLRPAGLTQTLNNNTPYEADAKKRCTTLNTLWRDSNTAPAFRTQLTTDNGYLTQEDLNDILSFNGKTVLWYGQVITLNIKIGDYEIKQDKVKTSSNDESTLAQMADYFVDTACEDYEYFTRISNEPTELKPAYYLCYKAKTISIKADAHSTKSWTTTIGKDTVRLQCADASYDMFCIPYGNIGIYNSTTFVEITQENALNIAQTIAQHFTSSIVYDLQLLPYCPIQEVIATDNNNRKYIDYSGLTSLHNYSLVNTTSTPSQLLGIVLWCSTCTGTFTINTEEAHTVNKKQDNFLTSEYQAAVIGGVTWYRATHNFNNFVDPRYQITEVKTFVQGGGGIYLNDFQTKAVINKAKTGFSIKYDSVLNSDHEYYIDVKYELTLGNIVKINELKLQNECDSWRICSPNYNGVYEFNVAKNRGLQFVTVDYTYKPYNPYIHVAPEFNGLYGSSFGDIRGLVCNGDFSVSFIGDKFADYELQNKNYQNIFDRQIKSMDIQAHYGRVQDALGAVTGSATGATSGGLAGLVGTGSVAGGAIGAAAGGALSLAGGLTDYYINERLRQEQRNLTTDMFSYQMGNIKALPYSLAKTSAMTANNKLFPFIEYYTCSSKEKEALRNKLKYNGMTVMTIGSIQDYIQSDRTFIKGQIIRIEDLTESTFVLNKIYEEINKGVYI